MLTVLPYYNTPIFLRILDIMPKELPALFSFLSNSKKHIQNPSRNLIIRALSTDSQLLDLVNSHVTQVIADGRDYHGLLAFWSSFSIWTIMSLKEQRVSQDDIANKFLPVVSQALACKKSPDAQTAGYMALTVMSTQLSLNNEIRKAAISTIVSHWTKNSIKSGFSCVTQLVEGSESDFVDLIDEKTFQVLDKMKHIDTDLIGLAERFNVGKFAAAWSVSVFKYKPSEISHVTKVIHAIQLSSDNTEIIMSHAVELSLSRESSAETKAQLTELIEKWLNKPESEKLLLFVLTEENVSFDNLELALQTSLRGRPFDSATEDVEMEDEDEQFENEAVDVVAQLKQSKVDSYLTRDSSVQEDFSSRLEIFLASFHQKSRPLDISLLKIKESALPSFLARIWASSLPVIAKVGALKLFEKHLKSDADYQSLIPCLLVGLYDDSEKVRKLAGSILGALADAKKPKSVWGLDYIYGPGAKSSEVKWLSEKEEKKLLLDVLGSRMAECYVDNTQVIKLFGFVKSSKELKSLGPVLLSFFSSHAVHCEIPSIVSLLLRITVQLDPKASVKVFAPILETFIENYDSWKEACHADNFPITELQTSLAYVVNSSEKAGLQFLQDCISSNDYTLAKLAGSRIKAIWSNLKPDAQLYLLRFLSDASVNDNLSYDTMEILNEVQIASVHFVALLDDCKLERESGASSNTAGSVAKRRRRSSASSKQQLQSGELAGFAEKHLRKLTGILELLERSNEIYNTKLLSQLFVILGEVLSLGIDSNLPVLYTQQVLANCMIEVVNQLKEQNARSLKIDSNLVRVDIIVSCIRSCPSPQVQNRFLLLVANLAGLAPEVVLHSVMPIFTFMGANTLRQDDELSAHAIQQTISQVVPALLNSTQTGEELDFLLLSFAATFVHIPRHRRLKLFATLVQTLGVEKSLYKLILLLALKYSESKDKRKFHEAKAIINFTKTYLRSFSVPEQVNGIEQYLAELDELSNIEKGDEDKLNQLQTALNTVTSTNLTDFYLFLEQVIDDETIPGTQSLRMSFLVLSEENKAEGNKVVMVCKNILQHLVAKGEIAGEAMHTDEEGESELLSQVSFNLLNKILSILPISDFTGIIVQVLNSNDESALVREIVGLIGVKFKYELSTDEQAQEAAWTVISVINENISKHPQVSSAIFDSLDILITKFSSGELGKEKASQLLAILDTVSGPLGLLNEDLSCYIGAVACANSICNALGARAIGKFPKIIPPVCKRFEAALAESSESNDMIQLASFALFGGLIKRMPTFMVTYLSQILSFVFSSSINGAQRQRLLSIIIESMKSNEIIDALSKTWAFARNSGVDSMVLYLDTVDSVVEVSSKKEVTSSSNTLISIVLDIFELRKQDIVGVNVTNRIESKAVSSALAVIMKLNDKTFRPLFIRMSKWALDGFDQAKLAVFFKFFVKLLLSLKSIVTNYYGYVLEGVLELLKKMAEEPDQLIESLKRSLLNSLVASFQYDKDEFWQAQSRFDKISSSLTDLIPTIQNNLGNILVKAIAGLAEAGGSTDLYKSINELVGAHLKADCKVSEKIWAVRTIKALYTRLGEEWVTFLPQLVPLIAELLEDDDESVELEVRRNLVPVVEEVLGESLDRYLS